MNYTKKKFPDCRKIQHLQSSKKQIVLLGTIVLIVLLKHSERFAENKAEVRLILISSLDGSKTIKSMETWKLYKEIEDVEG